MMREMPVVSEKELQSVMAWPKRNFGLGLARTEMQVVLVIRNGLIETGKLRVDDQMMMPRIRLRDASRRDPHPHQTEADHGVRRNARALARILEVNFRMGRRWCRA